MTSIETIGVTAGVVWKYLDANGPASLHTIEKTVDAPKSLIPMALGWLAREGKLAIEREGRIVRYAVTG
jgi:hypothetical protein